MRHQMHFLELQQMNRWLNGCIGLSIAPSITVFGYSTCQCGLVNHIHHSIRFSKYYTKLEDKAMLC